MQLRSQKLIRQPSSLSKNKTILDKVACQAPEIMHPHLQRQLEQLGLAGESPSLTAGQWQLFLEQVSDTYRCWQNESPQPEESETARTQANPTEQSLPSVTTDSEIESLRATASSLGAGLCLLDPRGSVLAVNPEAERLLGWRESELAGTLLLDRIFLKPKKAKKSKVLRSQQPPENSLPNSPIETKISLKEAIAKNQPCRSPDDRFLCRDGKVLPVSYFFNPATDGSKIAVLVFFDITEAKGRAREQERSLSMLQGVLESADAGILAVDRNGNICSYNQKFIEMWGLTAANEKLGRAHGKSSLTETSELKRQAKTMFPFAMHQLKHPQKFLKNVMKVSAHPDAQIEDLLEFKEGKILELNSLPSKVGEKIVGRVWSFRDVTERKRVEEALQYRVEFESLITSLSTHFISLSVSEIDRGINQALQATANLSGFDRSYIYLLSEDKTRAEKTYEWCAPGKEPPAENLKTIAIAQIPWIAAKIQTFESIHIPETDKLPPQILAEIACICSQNSTSDESAIAENLPFKTTNNLRSKIPQKHERSLIIIPLVCSKTPVGFLGFDAANPAANRSPEISGLLKMVGEMLANALERKRVELALQQAEAKYRSIFENAVEGICQTIPEGRYLSANHALARIYGYESCAQMLAELTDINRQLYVNPNRRAEFVAAMQESKEISRFESQVYRRDRSIIWIAENCRSITDSSGNILYYEGTVQDITERKQAESAMHRALEAAESANRAKSTFLANMSHELRTPLNAIIGYSEMLGEEAQDAEELELAGDLEKIRSAGKHLLSLIDDILDISKIEAGRMELYLETFDISSLIDSAVATALPLVEKNGNTIEIQCSPSLQTMHADMTKVRQVLLNLLSNAAKFTKNGKISIGVETIRNEELRMKHQQEAAQILISNSEFLSFRITDTGIGMTPEQLQRVFQPFTQADASTTRQYGGTGLGLAISQRFCQMMGGSIEVASNLGTGSTFTVLLPSEIKHPEIQQKVRVSSSPPRAPVAGTVLVVDDDPISRDLIERTLARQGLRIEHAASGEQALIFAKQLRPDAITLDVMMPGMDGWAVLSALKADPELAEIPVILLSFVGNKSLGFALGASDYLTKPVDSKRLAALLDKYRRDRDGVASNNSSGQILIVEDDFATREIVRRILEKHGWAVATANSGSAALLQLEVARPHLILLDLMLPEMDGFELIGELRKSESGKAIPIVVITGKELTEIESQQLEGSVDRVLQKGVYSCDTLLRQVRELVNASLDRRYRQGEEKTNG